MMKSVKEPIFSFEVKERILRLQLERKLEIVES